MSYPSAIAAPQPETVTNVLGNTLEHLRELDGRLTAIQQKIAPTPENNASISSPSSGTLSLALEVRTAATRLIARCNEIDHLL